MKIGIIGMGVVGTAYKTGLETKNFEVTGYDINKEQYQNNFNEILTTKIVLLCLPTIAHDNGCMNITPFKYILDRLKTYKYKGLIIIKSSLIPGTTLKLYKEYKLNIVHSPEFLSMATALYDVLNPSKIILGMPNKKIIVDDFYRVHVLFNTEIITTDSNTSEFTKLMQNSFYATKVTFANEMNKIANVYDADYDKAKELLYKEWRIGSDHLSINENKNFGGACLPKDTSQLLKDLEGKQLNSRLLNTIKKINEKELKK